MAPRSGPGAGDRAVSETTSALTLVAVAVVTAGALGGMVLLESPDDEGPPSGNVTFEHDAENGALLVTYREGDEIPAGQLRIRSADANTTWAAVANMNESAPVTPGAIVRLSRQSEYGAGVDRGDRVELVWFGDGGNQTAVLDSWPS